MTKAELDYEARTGYSVTVTATDPSSARDSISAAHQRHQRRRGRCSGPVVAAHPGRRALTATLTDPDGGVSALAWQWYRSPSSNSGWQPINGAHTRTYTPVQADLGRYLRAVAAYTDNHDSQQPDSAEAITARQVVDHVDPNSGGGPVGGGPEPARPQRAGFTDVDPTGSHAASIEALFAAGITVGCSREPLRFCPDRAVSRAQMASFLISALDALESN